ncbi:hypothetical protein AB1Y20_006478 [Prymnesium parvum]|uniref:EF-hand domain-containing protein n=1 Tax=Prymnesium parvum TaxID=97485 RepID=A0AB34IZS4_PRYPA
MPREPSPARRTRQSTHPKHPADAAATAETAPPVALPKRQPSSLVLKRKSTAKGLIKLKPKLGCRTLAQQASDYTTILLILLLTAALGHYLLEQRDALDAQARAHEVHPHAEEHAAHESHPALDVHTTLGICVLLISITILFEILKHQLEHHVPPMMTSVLQALFGELTVLGFIALFAYFMLRLGFLGWASLMVFGDEEHLVHLFEDVHFLLFFAVILVRASLKAESYWMSVESLVSQHRRDAETRASFAPVVAQLLVTYKAGKADCCRRFCLPRVLWSYREAEAREELRYALIRDRFVSPSGGPIAKAPLPTDFEFSGYLRREMINIVAHSLHVSVNTWLVVIVYLLLIIEVPLLLDKLGHAHVNVFYVIAMGWSLWGACCLFQALHAKLDRIIDQLTPRHPLLKGPPRSFDLESPTQTLLQQTSSPPFDDLKATSSCSKHEQLFWRGRNGPQFLIFLIRVLMILSSISVAVLWLWLTTKPQDVYLVLLGVLPVMDVIISAPQHYLPAAVLATSIEHLKKQESVNQTLQEMKTEKSLKMLKMLNTLSAQARRAQKLNSSELKRQRGAPKARELDAEQEAELYEAFSLFDKDRSGYIDREELGLLMKSLGVDLDQIALNNLYTEMDPSGDGQIDFKEFAQAMARDPEEQQSTVEMATAIFSMLDKSGDGKVSIAEMKSAMISMNPSLKDEDIQAAMLLFDKNGTGDMSKQEFVQGIEAMKTFASS